MSEVNLKIRLRTVLLLRFLAVMILGLMALGAGVRAMNAGLSCPDWPLCFGKLVPDFHPGVWFEQGHRLYAGLVSIIFLSTCVYLLRAAWVPRSTKRAAVTGLVFLFFQIIAGGLTVLLQVKAFTVTSHLILATLFFCSVLWMMFSLEAEGAVRTEVHPRDSGARWLPPIFAALSFGILMQITIGGLVASTYSGLICVDWPLCNGQWIPTLTGPMGLQVVHRFMAYALAAATLALAGAIQFGAFGVRKNRVSEGARAEFASQIVVGSRVAVLVVFLQILIGVINLKLFIPPAVTVLHQTVAITFLAVNLRMFFFAKRQLGVGAL